MSSTSPRLATRSPKKRSATFAFSFTNEGALACGRSALRVEEPGPGVIAPGDLGGQQLGRGSAHCEAPLPETRGHPYVPTRAGRGAPRRARRQPACGREWPSTARARGRSARAPTPPGGCSGPRRRPGRSCGSPRPRAASRRARGSNVRATRSRGTCPRVGRLCDRPPRTSAPGGNGRSRARGRGTKVRCHDHVLGAHELTAGRAHSAAVDVRGHRPLVNRPLERPREPLQVLHRVELGLLLEAHRARHRERKVHVLGERGREAELASATPTSSCTFRGRTQTRRRCSSACGAGRSRCRARPQGRRRARCQPRSPHRTPWPDPTRGCGRARCR